MNIEFQKKMVLFMFWISIIATISGCCIPPEFSSPESPLPATSPVKIPPIQFPATLGGQVLFHRKEESGILNIFLLDLVDGSLTQLTAGQGNNFDPVWSPDGTKIAFISDRGQRPPYGTLWLMNADGSDQHALLEVGDQIELGPTWSPDGTRIAFQSNRGGKNNPDIFILDLASGDLKNLTEHPNTDANPAWSPDGKQIAFVSDRSGNPEIWVIDIDSASLLQITDRPVVGDWRPSWSPDSQNLIFESFPTVAPRLLHIQGLSDAEARKVNTAFIWNQWPAWITEDLILFAASEEYDEDTHKGSPANLYLQNMNTGEIHQLTSGSGDDGRPSWRP